MIVGWSSECQRCDRHYTFHGENVSASSTEIMLDESSSQAKIYQRLHCHHCGSIKKVPLTCPSCASENMIPVGMGTKRLEETINNLFPKAKIQRIDRDTTRKKTAMDAYISSIKSGDTDILIGTQMLAKGHHFPNVTLVGLIDMGWRAIQ